MIPTGVIKRQKGIPTQSFWQGIDITQSHTICFRSLSFRCKSLYTFFYCFSMCHMIPNNEMTNVTRLGLLSGYVFTSSVTTWNRIANKEALTLLGGRDHCPWIGVTPIT